MGRGGPKAKQWQENGGRGWPVSASQLWKGAWSSPRGRNQAPWKDGSWAVQQGQAFPSFDSQALAVSKEEAEPSSEHSGTGPPQTRAVQAALNAARRAEQRVERLERDQATVRSQWSNYVTTMKQAYMKEKGRCQSRIVKLEKAHAEARHQLDAARVAFRNVVVGQAPELQEVMEVEAAETGANRLFEQWDLSAAPDWTGIATRALGSEPVHTPARPRTSRQMTPPAARSTEFLGASMAPLKTMATPAHPATMDPYLAMAMAQQQQAAYLAADPADVPLGAPPGFTSPGQAPKPPDSRGHASRTGVKEATKTKPAPAAPALFVLRQVGSEETGCAAECGSHPFRAWAHDRTSECRGTRCGSPMCWRADGDHGPGGSSGILSRWSAQSARSRQHRGRRLRPDRCGSRAASNGSISPYGCERAPALCLGGEPDSGWLRTAGAARAGIFPLESPINGKFAWAVVRPGQFPLDQQLLGWILFGSTCHRRTEWRSCQHTFHLYSRGVSVHMPRGTGLVHLLGLAPASAGIPPGFRRHAL